MIEPGVIVALLVFAGLTWMAFSAIGGRVALVMVAILVVAVLVVLDRHADDREQQDQRRVAVRAERAIEREAAIAWRRRVDGLGQHGPAEATPPMLEVTSEGNRLRVVNKGPIEIECMFIYRAPSVGGTSMRYPVRTESGYGCATIRPGATVDFRDVSDEIRASHTLEFRIGSPERPEPTWWSDSALRDFDTRGFEQVYALPR